MKKLCLMLIISLPFCLVGNALAACQERREDGELLISCDGKEHRNTEETSFWEETIEGIRQAEVRFIQAVTQAALSNPANLPTNAGHWARHLNEKSSRDLFVDDSPGVTTGRIGVRMYKTDKLALLRSR